VEDHQIVVPDVESDKNLADFFTKPLTKLTAGLSAGLSALGW